MPEVLVVIGALGILAAIAVSGQSGIKTAASEGKLRRDIVNLNSLVGMYVANGGSVDGLTEANEVLSKLKTQLSEDDARRYVGMTGKNIDYRLMAKPQTSDQTASHELRAVWVPSKERFVLTSEPGVAGVSGFYHDENVAETQPTYESRATSKMRYDGDRGPTWVWEYGAHDPEAPLVPLEVGLAAPSPPLEPPPAPGTPPSSKIQLPPPLITPGGGAFLYADFPSVITILSNAPLGAASRLMYQLLNADGSTTGWRAYTTGFTVQPEQTVQAVNFSLDDTRYLTSSVASAEYEPQKVMLPTPAITPAGGTFSSATFPAKASIDANGAPNGSASALRYMIEHKDGSRTLWINYNAPFALLEGDTVSARNVSLEPVFFSDSSPATENYKRLQQKLPPPILAETTENGKRVVVMTMPADVPMGAYIGYTTNGLDPDIDSRNAPMRGTTYRDPARVPNNPPFEVMARIYPPKALAMDYIPSELADLDLDFTTLGSPGLASGHIDVDTSSASYGLGSGRTDGHVHAYDDKHDVEYVDMMHLLSNTLRNIQDVIPKGTRFKLIVSNADLSTGARLSINQNYDPNNPATYQYAQAYDNNDPSFLPTYSIDGAAGTTKLTNLVVSFTQTAIDDGGLVGTVTGAVRSNKPGTQGEYRNGAFIIQAIEVNADGSPKYTTDKTLSVGGVQGVATSGLLWEATMFWHWNNGARGVVK